MFNHMCLVITTIFADFLADFLTPIIKITMKSVLHNTFLSGLEKLFCKHVMHADACLNLGGGVQGF